MFRVILPSIFILAGAQSALGQALQNGVPPPFGVPLTQYDSHEAAIRSGNGFVASAPTLSVAAGSVYNFELCNAAGSGRKAIVYKRRFDSNMAGGGAALGYGGVSGPAAIASPTTTSMGSNLITGGATSSAVTFTAAVATTRVTGTLTATGFLPTNGDNLKLEEPRIILPGVFFANFIGGAAQSGGLSGNISAGMTVYWIEEPYP